MGNAFSPCGGCNCFTYAAVFAKWYYPTNGPFATFEAGYLDAIARVKAVDISTVPQKKIRFFDYSAGDGTFVDHGNVDNDGTQWTGSGVGHGITDLGAICQGADSATPPWLSYVSAPYNFYGNTPFGGQQAFWANNTGSTDANQGYFIIMRLAVAVGNQECDAKWALVNWDNDWYPSGPLAFGDYSIDCLCDATSSGSCPACTNNGGTLDVVCVDIPDPSSFYQFNASLPCSARYFVPGANCGDLS